jgi:cytosine/adenosine deaminase-related metal-dependent hydrolase
VDKLIKNALVVTMDPQGKVFRGDVLISGGRIVEMGPGLDHVGGDIEIIDAGTRIVLPGFVNAHLHSYMTLLRGMAEGLDLHGWKEDELMVDLVNLTKREIDREILYKAHLLSYCEQIRGGVSFVGEFNFPEMALEAMREIGIKGFLTCDIDEMDRIREKVGEDDGHMIGLYIPEEEELSEDILLRIEEEGYGGAPVFKIMHAAETKWRVHLTQRRFGCNILTLLQKFSILDDHMIFSHGVHIDPDGIRVMRDAGVRVISSVTSEMKLSDGIAPVVSYLDEGIVLGLGTDSATCNNGGDVFSEMKVMGLLQSLVNGPDAVDAEQILRMATIDGARVFGMENEIGSIEVGKRADMILLDTRVPELFPLAEEGERKNIYSNLVYSACREQVKDLLVDGEFILRDRFPTRVDMNAVIGEIENEWKGNGIRQERIGHKP